ncbi:hypothetical protein BRDID11002_84090 [Bradyrhizobium diazoefficiens]
MLNSAWKPDIQRTFRCALHLHRMDVHGDVDGAERGAEGEQRQCQRRRRACDGQQRQDQRQTEPAGDDDRPAAVTRAHDSGQKHCDDRADAEAEQQQSENAVVDAEPCFRKRHQRRPARDAEARDEEGKSRRKPCRRPVGRKHENSGSRGKEGAVDKPDDYRDFMS